MKERQGSIYVLHNLVNDKEYVGQTIKQPASRRWDGHIYAAYVRKARRPLYAAMRKYGLENFTAEIVWTGPESKLNAVERRLIRQRSTFIDGGRGYNLTTGGDHFKLSRRSIAKLRRALRRRVVEQPTWFAHLVELMQAVNHTPEVEARRREALKAYAENRRKAGKLHFSRRTMRLLCAAAQRPRVISEMVHDHISAGQKKRWAEGRGFIVAATTCTKHSKNARRQWRVERGKMMAGIKKAVNNPVYRSRRSELAKAQWARMGDVMRRGIKAGHNKPESKARHSAENKRRWAVGVYKIAA